MKLPSPRTRLTRPEVHDLLRSISKQLGLPSQVLGPGLRIRWHQGENELLELWLRLVADKPGVNSLDIDTSEPQWRIWHEIKNRKDTLHEDYLDIEYAADPDIKGAVPYLWNLRINTELWDENFLPPILTWSDLCDDVGRVLGELPMTLAALPPEWYNQEITVHDPKFECFTAVATPEGLHVTLLRTAGKNVGTHRFSIPLQAAPEAGKALMETYASNYGPGFPISQLGMRMHISQKERLIDFILSDYETNEEPEVDLLGGGNTKPNYEERIPELIDQAEWYSGNIRGKYPGEVMAENLPDFPAWKKPPAPAAEPPSTKHAKPSYGIDAPPALYVVIGLAVLSLILGIAWHPAWYLAAALFAIHAGLFLHTTLRGKKQVWEKFLQQANLKGDEDALDLGCGRGAAMIPLAKHLPYGHVTGVDIWDNADQSGNTPEAAMRNAEIEGVEKRITLKTRDITEELPFLADTFDIVNSSLVMHNIHPPEKREKAILEAYTVTKPGGTIIITDLKHTDTYAQILANAGAQNITITSLGWKMWWGHPFMATKRVVATKPGV